MADVPSRAPSGVRIAGDDYQLLVSWNEVLTALLPESDVESVTIEDPDSASVDDVVIRYHDGSNRYVQVKHTVDASSPVGSGWLLTERGRGRSVLKKFFDSWRELRDQPGLDMELITDRQIDGNDPIMRCYDAATERLTPLVAGNLKAPAAASRRTWAEHVGADVEELTQMLSALRLRLGRPEAAERQRAELLMRLHGFAIDQSAVDAAMTFMHEWIRARWRQLNIAEVRERVLGSIPRRSDPWALFVIEGIDDHQLDAPAAVGLRFVERYDGADSYSRRQLRHPADWPDVYAEIIAAADALRSSSRLRVLVAGSMRLPMWFAAGTALRHVRGFTVAAHQTGELWASNTYAWRAGVDADAHLIGQGDDLAVAVSITNDICADVVACVTKEELGVSTVVSIAPSGGPSDQSVADGRHAVGLALAVRDAVRDALPGAERIHLFLSAPAGLALLLGHRWNALAPTVVYEHLVGQNYAPTFATPG